MPAHRPGAGRTGAAVSAQTLDRPELVDPADLVCVGQIAQRTGHSRSVIYHWRSNYRGLYPRFPEPIAQHGQWLVFHWPEVAGWVERRFGGRPDWRVCFEDVLDL